MGSESQLAIRISASPEADLKDLRARSNALQQSLWVLRAAKDIATTPRLTAREVRAVLAELEVAVSLNAVKVALSRAANSEAVEFREAGEVTYSISSIGRELLQTTSPTQQIEVWVTEPNRKWTAWRKLEALAGELTGDLAVIDPYYGLHSLQVLEMFSAGRASVRLLTSQAATRKGVSGPTINTAAKLLQKQIPSVEIRLLGGKAPFHDRYILSTDGLAIIGHGLEDLGERESFVIRLHADLIADLLAGAKSTFESRWNNATPVP